MTARIKEKDGTFYCSNCRMRIKLSPQCGYCACIFSNFEDMLLEYYDIIMEDEVKNEENLYIRNH